MKKLTERQLKAIPHIVTAATYTESIKRAKISRKTFYEWMKIPTFKQELIRQREEIAKEAFGVLEQSLTKAVENLVGIIDTEDERLKRLACNDIIEHILKYREIQNLEKRLAQVETQLSARR